MKSDPTYMIVFDYRGDLSDRRYWSGRRWVCDPSDAQLYAWARARVEFDRVTRPPQFNTGTFLVEDYGLTSERVAMECRGEAMPPSSAAEVSP